MSKRTGIFVQIYRNIKKSMRIANQKTTQVGEDHFGNKYFLKEADPQNKLKESRYVEPKSKDQFVPPELPIEWEAWLRYKRKSPPTQEELDKAYAVSMRILQRARELEEKDNLEKEYPSSESPTAAITSTVTSNKDKKKFPERPGLELVPGSRDSINNEKPDR